MLAEGDDQQDPIVDTARAVLDGHIVLTRELAAQGHFPAIDILQSISRLMPQLVDRSHRQAATSFRKFYAAYEENKDLISVGAYQRGSNEDIDQALRQLPFMKSFLRHDMGEAVNYQESLDELIHLPEECDESPSSSRLNRHFESELIDG